MAVFGGAHDGLDRFGRFSLCKPAIGRVHAVRNAVVFLPDDEPRQGAASSPAELPALAPRGVGAVVDPLRQVGQMHTLGASLAALHPHERQSYGAG